MTTSKRIGRIGVSLSVANVRRGAFIPLFLLAGCASTTVEMSGPGARDRWCAPDLSAEAVWSPAWRADQKEPAAREAIAERGIRRFFAESGCFASAVVSRAGSGLPASVDRTIVITVRELGPILTIGSPSVVQGGTEVVLDVKVVDNGAERAGFRVHWKYGGAFVVRGVGGLEGDMVAALRAALVGP